MPGQALPKSGFFDISFIDLIVHFGIFIVFSYLLTGTIFYNPKWEFSNKKIIYLVVIVAVIYSITTEIGQIFIPGRYFQLSDIIMDFLGSLFGIGLFFLKFKYISK